MTTVSELVTCSRQASKSATSTNTCYLNCCGHEQRDKWLQQIWDLQVVKLGLAQLNQHAMQRPSQSPQIWFLRRAPRLHFSPCQKTSAQRLSFQQQRQVTSSFFASPRAIVYDYRRHNSRRPEACCWWRRRSRWIWSHKEDCVKIIWYWIKV